MQKILDVWAFQEAIGRVLPCLKRIGGIMQNSSTLMTYIQINHSKLPSGSPKVKFDCETTLRVYKIIEGVDKLARLGEEFQKPQSQKKISKDAKDLYWHFMFLSYDG